MLVRFVVLLLLLTTMAHAQAPDWRTASQEAYQLHKAGRTEEALKLAERAVELAGEADDPLAVATTTNTWGLICLELEDFYNADKRFELAASLYESDPRLGPEHEFTAKVYKNRGLCLQELGRYRESETYLRKALHNYELLDPEHHHPLTLDILKGLANTLLEEARLEEARDLYQEVVTKSEADSLEAHQARQGLASICSTLGEYDQAEQILLPVVGYYEDTDAPSIQSFDRLATVLGSLGGIKLEQGDFKKAEELYTRSLELRRRTAPGRPSVAASMNNLALLYADIGDLTRAEPLYREALEIHEDSLGPIHPRTSTSLNNLALLLSRQGKREQAEPLLLRSLEIERSCKGKRHPDTARALSNLGTLYLETERPALALPLFEEAESILALDGGPAHATALSNLGSVYHRLGRLEEASKAFRQVLAEGAADNVYTAHNNISYLLIDQDQPELALSHARSASEVLFKRLQNVFSFTSERQRLDFKRTLNPYGLSATLNSPDDCFQAALRFKGTVLDSIVEDRRLARAARDPELRELLDEIELKKRELLELELEKNPTERLSELRRQVEEGEGALARRLSSFGEERKLFSITPEMVQSKIPDKTVLVEFLYHGYYLGQNRSEKRYSALIVPARGKIQLVSLGPAEDVDEKIREYRESLLGSRSATRASRVFLSKTESGRDPAALLSLYETVWRPLESKLPDGTQSVLLCPDGELNFVSFATLLDENNRFLAERYELSYLSSARDLLAEKTQAREDARVINLFGNPAYGVHDEGIQGVVLSPLPGTEAECRTLEEVLEGQRTVLALGEEAQELKVREETTADILHVATHGLFLSEKFGPRNPMSRSGLAFVGAQTTLDKWARGESVEPSADGLLTAEEVGTMNLSNTELVVLSACDTGLGATENGEGVLGLRRGFVKSGARNLLFTLWPIDDSETVRFMTDFYRKLGSASPREALNKTQRDWLLRLKTEEGAVTAARLAGPFVLSSVGAP